MSLLYALFSTTMTKIKSESQALWLFRRYQVICKFEKSPPLPPPFSSLCYVYDCIRLWFRRRCGSGCCWRKGGCCGGSGGVCDAGCGCLCCGRSRCDCCGAGHNAGGFDDDVDNADIRRHEAFFWTQTRKTYLTEKTEKETKRQDKDKFLNELGDSVAANLLLSKTSMGTTTAAETTPAREAENAPSSSSIKDLLAEAMSNQRSVGALEASLAEKSVENSQLLKRLEELNGEIERLKLLVGVSDVGRQKAESPPDD